MTTRPPSSHGHVHRRGPLLATSLGALGVVYGDIGTSPLYSIHETFVNKHHNLAPTKENVLGAISIVVWTLVLIVAIKYVVLVMRADNKGEGGILALTALISDEPAGARRTPGLVLLGLFGTALLVGDGMITPSISVLSAIEGTELINPGFADWVVPISVAILVGLFAMQRWGTERVGKIFGPVMLVWFGVMAVFGSASLARNPEILQAISPHHAVQYFVNNGFKGFLSMGALFLVVTGGEALYADMGHFGRRPIRFSWFGVVMPALLLCYLGIGALLLRDQEAVHSPFFLMSPSAVRVPVIILATLATIIASQALISGVFSIVLQGTKLGYLPRSRTINTSHAAAGQIYIPVVNWLLMAACVGLVLAFRSSSALAAAYGLSVTGTMFATTLLFAVFVSRRWHWPKALVFSMTGVLLAIEGAFLGANLFKIPEGGWFPLVVGAVVFAVFTTWKTGKRLVYERSSAGRVTVAQYARSIDGSTGVVRTEGTAVFLYSRRHLVPTSLIDTVKATGALPRKVYVVCVETAHTPTVPAAQRESAVDHPGGFREVVLRYGFMEPTPVADDLRMHCAVDPTSATYFLGRESVRATSLPGMARWRESLFTLLHRNTADVGSWFELPPNRVIEVGSRVEL